MLNLLRQLASDLAHEAGDFAKEALEPCGVALALTAVAALLIVAAFMGLCGG